MPHVEYDTDDLFQRAGGEYPLRNVESNWETVAKRLNERSADTKKPAKPRDHRRKYLLAILLLLITLMLTNIILIQIKRRTENKNDGKVTDKSDRIKDQHGLIPVTAKKQIDRRTSFPSSENTIIVPGSEKFALTTSDPIISVVDRDRLEPLENDYLAADRVNLISPDLNAIKNRNAPLVTVDNAKNFITAKRFYWGILAGPQVNQVRKQEVVHTDADAGIVAGLRINKHWAIETGLFYGEKCYHSQAKYFKMAPDSSMPANMLLMDITGKNHVASIPLKLRYDIINSRNDKFFITTGLSSYVFTQQNNNYHAMVNGSENNLERTYKKNSFDAAANITISAGLEHRIVKDHFIRVEPYLQIPIKGIGVGCLPVTTTGIHIGIIANKRKR